MKTLKFISLISLCSLFSAAHAQELDMDTTRNPVRQGDPEVHQSPEQLQDNNLLDMVKITADQIPTEMQNALNGSDYHGSGKAFYRSKTRDTYLVEIKDGNITRTYRFDKKGKRINENRNH